MFKGMEVGALVGLLSFSLAAFLLWLVGVPFSWYMWIGLIVGMVVVVLVITGAWFFFYHMLEASE